MRGGDTVARELIRTAIARTYDRYFANAKVEQIVQWFDLGGQIQIAETASSSEVLSALKAIQGLMDKLSAVEVNSKAAPEAQVSAAEFLLEGLHAHKRVGRSEERMFKAEKTPKRQERTFEHDSDDFP